MLSFIDLPTKLRVTLSSILSNQNSFCSVFHAENFENLYLINRNISLSVFHFTPTGCDESKNTIVFFLTDLHVYEHEFHVCCLKLWEIMERNKISPV